jgi:hypothetical protein
MNINPRTDTGMPDVPFKVFWTTPGDKPSSSPSGWVYEPNVPTLLMVVNESNNIQQYPTISNNNTVVQMT